MAWKGQNETELTGDQRDSAPAVSQTMPHLRRRPAPADRDSIFHRSRAGTDICHPILSGVRIVQKTDRLCGGTVLQTVREAIIGEPAGALRGLRPQKSCIYSGKSPLGL